MLADHTGRGGVQRLCQPVQVRAIKVDPGQRIRIWVLDAGPNDISSFHIVGTIFDTVFKEGHYELQPGNPTGGGSQALDLMPAQGGFVETTFAQPGVYTMVSTSSPTPAKATSGPSTSAAPPAP